MANPITLVLQVPPMAVGGGGEVGGDMLDMMILSVLPVPLAVAVVETGMERGEDIVADKVADYIIGDMVGGRGRHAGSGHGGGDRWTSSPNPRAPNARSPAAGGMF